MAMRPSDIELASKRATAVSFMDSAVAFNESNFYWDHEIDDDGFIVIHIKKKKEKKIRAYSLGLKENEILIKENVPFDEGVRFGIVESCFRCDENITNLKGFPTIVKSALVLSYTTLDNFEGCPREVKGPIWIVGTIIKHFKGYCLPLDKLQGSVERIENIPGFKAYKLIEKVSRV